MPINLRGNATVADGSITEAKLAPNSVSAAKIQTDAVIDTKIAANAVTNTKIAADAVTTTKIANDAVSIAKVSTEVATESFFGSEQTIENTGDTETSVADFNFIKAADTTSNWQKLSYKIKLNTDNVANTAMFKIYVDTVLYGSGTTTISTTPVVLSEVDLDISALSAGSHHVELKLDNSDVAGISTLTQVDIYLAKK